MNTYPVWEPDTHRLPDLNCPHLTMDWVECRTTDGQKIYHCAGCAEAPEVEPVKTEEYDLGWTKLIVLVGCDRCGSGNVDEGQVLCRRCKERMAAA